MSLDRIEFRVFKNAGDDFGEGKVLFSKGRVGNITISTLGGCGFDKLGAGPRGITAANKGGALISAPVQPDTSEPGKVAISFQLESGDNSRVVLGVAGETDPIVVENRQSCFVKLKHSTFANRGHGKYDVETEYRQERDVFQHLEIEEEDLTPEE